MGRFWCKITIQDDGCWLWQAALGADGYGRAWDGAKVVLAHRLAYELEVGPVEPGMFVCHKCDVRACVRPDHLFQGTARDNSHDMVGKGRLNQRPGTDANVLAASLRTHCRRGHEYGERNPRRSQDCRECNRQRSQAWRDARKHGSSRAV